MKQILAAIFADEIADFLAFKGGTLVYLNHALDRFSTDIDLDILDLEQEELIIQRVREILTLLGEIKNETLGKTLHRWIFRYDERSTNIKVELNKRIRKNNSYNLQNIEQTDILCMTKDAIFANKLVALSERFYNRDLYDVHFFFKNSFPINENLITERTGLSLDDFLTKLIKELPSIYPENSMLKDMGEILDNKQKYRVKTQLLTETIAQIQTFISKN